MKVANRKWHISYAASTAAFLVSALVFISPTAASAQNTSTMRIGQIASIQLEDGQPAWIQSGYWVLRINSEDSVSLMVRMNMVMPDGTAAHTHTMSNLSVTEHSFENNVHSITGTATVSMREGDVDNVPVDIKVMNNEVITIMIGPEMVDNHFGSSPVYGTVFHPRTPSEEPPASTTPTAVQLSAQEIDETYRWMVGNEINPTLKIMANSDNTITVQNPTDEEHEFIIESEDGEELASSGDIEAGESGQVMFRPTSTGMIEYYCEYHPTTMNGVIEVVDTS